MSLKMTMTESSGFDLHEPDEWLSGKITAIEETDGMYGPGLKWIILLDDENWDTWAFCSQKLSTRSKLYDWIKGLDPQNLPEPGGTVDLKQYVGKRVQVMFEQYETETGLREKVVKLRAEKKPAASLSQKQGQAARAKKPLDDPDEAPF